MNNKLRSLLPLAFIAGTAVLTFAPQIAKADCDDWYRDRARFMRWERHHCDRFDYCSRRPYFYGYPEGPRPFFHLRQRFFD